MQAMIGQVGLEFIERAKCRGPVCFSRRA